MIKDKLNIFFSLQNVGIDKGDIPDLTKVHAQNTIYYLAVYKIEIRVCSIVYI